MAHGSSNAWAPSIRGRACDASSLFVDAGEVGVTASIHPMRPDNPVLTRPGPLGPRHPLTSREAVPSGARWKFGVPPDKPGA